MLVLLAAAWLSLSTAYASGGITCRIEATVLKIQATGILDDTVEFERHTQIDTYRHIAFFEVKFAKRIRGTGTCPVEDLVINLKSRDQLKVGDTVKLIHRFAHDRPGHSLTYELQ